MVITFLPSHVLSGSILVSSILVYSSLALCCTVYFIHCWVMLCCSMCSSLLSSRLLLYRLFYFAMLCCSILFTKYLSKKNFGSLFCFGFLCYHLVFCTFLNKALLYSTILCSFCLKIIFGVTICQAIQHCLVLCCVMQRCNAFQWSSVLAGCSVWPGDYRWHNTAVYTWNTAVYT